MDTGSIPDLPTITLFHPVAAGHENPLNPQSSLSFCLTLVKVIPYKHPLTGATFGVSEQRFRRIPPGGHTMALTDSAILRTRPDEKPLIAVRQGWVRADGAEH